MAKEVTVGERSKTTVYVCVSEEKGASLLTGTKIYTILTGSSFIYFNLCAGGTAALNIEILNLLRKTTRESSRVTAWFHPDEVFLFPTPSAHPLNI